MIIYERDLDFFTLQAMEKWGGSFVKQLAVLCRLADYENYNKLRLAFEDYFDHYKERGDQLADEYRKSKGRE